MILTILGIFLFCFALVMFMWWVEERGPKKVKLGKNNWEVYKHGKWRRVRWYHRF